MAAHPPSQDRSHQTQVNPRILNINTQLFLQDLQGTRSSGRLWQRDRQHPERRSAWCLLLLPGAAHLVRPLLQLQREAAAGSLRRAVSRGTKRGPCPCPCPCNPAQVEVDEQLPWRVTGNSVRWSGSPKTSATRQSKNIGSHKTSAQRSAKQATSRARSSPFVNSHLYNTEEQKCFA